MSAKAARKSMKINIFLDLKFWALKSLAKNSAQKLSKENAHFPFEHSMSAAGLRKSMKSRISNDFATWALKSLKNFFVKKLSTACSSTAAFAGPDEVQMASKPEMIRNQHFYRLGTLRVEIIDDFFRQKVIHKQPRFRDRSPWCPANLAGYRLSR